MALNNLLDRFKAGLIHLTFSLFLITLITGLTIIYFYPGVFLDIEGIDGALKILVPVDIILGPFLTFLIYNKGKRGLKFDLKFIVTCQIIALVYGCYSICMASPGYLVLYKDAFYIAPKYIDQEPLTDPSLKVSQWSRPVQIYLDVPDDNNELLKLAVDSMATGKALPFNTNFYTPLDNAPISEIKKYAMKKEKIIKLAKKQAYDMKHLSQYTENNLYAFYPVTGSSGTTVLVLDINKKKPVDILDIFPYQ